MITIPQGIFFLEIFFVMFFFKYFGYKFKKFFCYFCVKINLRLKKVFYRFAQVLLLISFHYYTCAVYKKKFLRGFWDIQTIQDIQPIQSKRINDKEMFFFYEIQVKQNRQPVGHQLPSELFAFLSWFAFGLTTRKLDFHNDRYLA